MSHAAPLTTPDAPPAPTPLWRRTHATAWFFLSGLGLWLFLLLVPHALLGNPAIVPAWVLIGSGLAASTLLFVMLRRLQPTDGVSIATILWAAFVGGFISIAIGSTLDSLVGVAATDFRENVQDVSLFLAGFTEEFAKIVAVVIVGWRISVKTARGGLFIGGAVGVGFAILENLWYITKGFITGVELSQKLPEHAPAIETILVHPSFEAARAALLRTIVDPFGHPLWTALFAAALFGAARNGRFRITVGVVLAYLGVAVMHGLWDGNTVVWALLFPKWEGATALTAPTMVILSVAFALIWRAWVRRINREAGVVSVHVSRRARRAAAR